MIQESCPLLTLCFLAFPLQTNDFFTTSWGDGTVVQFEGFPPGVDVQAVIAAIAASIQIIGDTILSGRRQLQGSTSQDHHGGLRRVRGRRSLLPGGLFRPEQFAVADTATDDGPKSETKSTTTSNKCSGSKKSGSKSETGSKSASKSKTGSKSKSGCVEDEEEPEPVEVIIDAEEVTTELLTNLGDLTTAEDVEVLVLVVVAPLESIFDNTVSYNEVLDGEPDPVFLDNIDAMGGAIDSIQSSDAVVALPLAQKETVAKETEKANELIALLRSVVEGI